jgi:hypothetical protein
VLGHGLRAKAACFKALSSNPIMVKQTNGYGKKTNSEKLTISKKGWGSAQGCSACEALPPNSSTAKKKEKIKSLGV